MGNFILILFDYIFFKLLFLSVKLYNSVDDTFMYAHLHTLGHEMPDTEDIKQFGKFWQKEYIFGGNNAHV